MCYLAGLILTRVFDGYGLMLVNKSMNERIGSIKFMRRWPGMAVQVATLVNRYYENE